MGVLSLFIHRYFFQIITLKVYIGNWNYILYNIVGIIGYKYIGII